MFPYPLEWAKGKMREMWMTSYKILHPKINNLISDDLSYARFAVSFLRIWIIRGGFVMSYSALRRTYMILFYSSVLGYLVYFLVETLKERGSVFELYDIIAFKKVSNNSRIGIQLLFIFFLVSLWRRNRLDAC